MGKSAIEWVEEGWPVTTGCSPVSEGCANCWAARLASRRLKNHPRHEGLTVRGEWTGEVRYHAELLRQPFHWRKPRTIFVCPMSDIFHPGMPTGLLTSIVAVMLHSQCKQHQFLLLTKRPEEPLKMGADFSEANNIWLGVSVESPDYLSRVEDLLKIPAAHYFVSLEPLLAEIELFRYLDKLSWVICGGESGPGARHCDHIWIRYLRDQCRDNQVPCYVKQLGSAWARNTGWARTPDYKGAKIEHWPGDLQIRETPKELIV